MPFQHIDINRIVYDCEEAASVRKPVTMNAVLKDACVHIMCNVLVSAMENLEFETLKHRLAQTSQNVRFRLESERKKVTSGFAKFVA